MLFLLTLVAFAADTPVVEVHGSDTVVGRLRVEAPPEDVRRQLADPAWVTRVASEGTTAVVSPAEGSCLSVDYTTPQVLLTVRYAVTQCPKADGVVQKLVSSNAFRTYEAAWSVTASPEGGSQVEYRVQLVPSLSVPSSMVTRSTRNGVTRMLERLGAWYGARPSGVR